LILSFDFFFLLLRVTSDDNLDQTQNFRCMYMAVSLNIISYLSLMSDFGLVQQKKNMPTKEPELGEQEPKL
jgi:hypothetical protein